jgi:hypothetical protein
MMHDDQSHSPEGQRTFPWEDVEAARNDRGLQKRHAAHRPAHLQVDYEEECLS